MSLGADLLLILHAAFVAFVVLGLPAIWLGLALGKGWARSPGFRIAHLAAILFVAGEALLGLTCPLTLWEDALRGTSGEQGFIERWVHAWLFWSAPPWVFTAAYVAFAGAVAWTWWRWPPRGRRSA